MEYFPEFLTIFYGACCLWIQFLFTLWGSRALIAGSWAVYHCSPLIAQSRGEENCKSWRRISHIGESFSHNMNKKSVTVIFEWGIFFSFLFDLYWYCSQCWEFLYDLQHHITFHDILLHFMFHFLCCCLQWNWYCKNLLDNKFPPCSILTKHNSSLQYHAISKTVIFYLML